MRKSRSPSVSTPYQWRARNNINLISVCISSDLKINFLLVIKSCGMEARAICDNTLPTISTEVYSKIQIIVPYHKMKHDGIVEGTLTKTKFYMRVENGVLQIMFGHDTGIFLLKSMTKAISLPIKNRSLRFYEEISPNLPVEMHFIDYNDERDYTQFSDTMYYVKLTSEESIYVGELEVYVKDCKREVTVWYDTFDKELNDDTYQCFKISFAYTSKKFSPPKSQFRCENASFAPFMINERKQMKVTVEDDDSREALIAAVHNVLSNKLTFEQIRNNVIYTRDINGW